MQRLLASAVWDEAWVRTQVRDYVLAEFGPGGVLIFSPAGKHLGTILTGEATAHVAFGDDGSTLYITADPFLARIKTKTKGNGF